MDQRSCRGGRKLAHPSCHSAGLMLWTLVQARLSLELGENVSQVFAQCCFSLTNSYFWCIVFLYILMSLFRTHADILPAFLFSKQRRHCLACCVFPPRDLNPLLATLAEQKPYCTILVQFIVQQVI